MGAPSVDDLKTLDVDSRLRIIAELWDSIVDGPVAPALSQADREMLDQRLAAYQADPFAGSSWAEVRARITDGR